MKSSLKWIISGLAISLIVVVLTWEQLGKPLLFDLFQAVTGHEKLSGETFRMPPSNTPYERWLEEARDALPLFEGTVIQDVRTVALQPWAAMGPDVSGLYLRFSDYQMTDGRILEIPAGANSTEQRHFFEMAVYAFGGPGHTIVQQEGKPPQRIDWDYRSLFSIPLNVSYRHFNDSGQAARLFAVTSFPFVINAVNSEEFVFENDYAAVDRYDGETEHFTRETPISESASQRNLVPDALAVGTTQQEFRGEGASGMRWIMSGNSMLSVRVSEMPAGLYKRAHRHSSDAFILLLSGDGYSLAWPGGQFARRERVDWREGTLFVPPIYWYHQHFNPGAEPARYLAVHTPYLVQNLGLRFIDQMKRDLPEVVEEWSKERERRITEPKP
jgi:hypothetical protein